MKTTLTLATLVLLASSMLPAHAVMLNNRTNTDFSRQPSQDLILAQNNFDQYRQQRHAQLEQQMREEVKKPQYNNLSPAQKAQMIRDSHKTLDQSLDREYETWKKQQSNNNNNGRYNNNGNYNNNNPNNQQSFDQYRQQRHAQLEQQMRQDMNQPQYRNLSAAQKAQMIRDAHINLDQNLDREYANWQRGNNNGNYNNNNPNNPNSQQSFDQYRQQRHAQLEQQMRQDMNQPQYRNLSAAQKAQMIRDAHINLDQNLDREYATWQRGNNNGNYNGSDRYDRYNRNNQPYPNGGYNR
ncbi:hypothetical protein [Planktothrix agardhii]|jgi:hypothetical protein|nr:hypothetical protein [Planktothrix agardhii]CAD5947777.1 hypothetical protein NIVACYA_02795 [Planktothrix agardhii]CAD5961070.1 hypothetical protein NO108_03546 [Planktothrix rubescens]